jgi:hypothetical protein
VEGRVFEGLRERHRPFQGRSRLAVVMIAELEAGLLVDPVFAGGLIMAVVLFGETRLEGTMGLQTAVCLSKELRGLSTPGFFLPLPQCSLGPHEPAQCCRYPGDDCRVPTVEIAVMRYSILAASLTPVVLELMGLQVK